MIQQAFNVNRILSLVVLLVLITILPQARGGQGSIEVTEGTGKEVATDTVTQGGTPVHQEQVVQYPCSFALAVGHIDIASTNTPVSIFSSSTPCCFVTITADPDNTTFIVVGSAAVTTADGARLYPGGSMVIKPVTQDACESLYIDGTADDGASVHTW